MGHAIIPSAYNHIRLGFNVLCSTLNTYPVKKKKKLLLILIRNSMLIVITCYKTNYVVIVYLTSSLISTTDVKLFSLYYNSNLTVVRSKRKYACLTMNKIQFVVDLSYVRSPIALGDTLENPTDYIYKI